MFEEGLAKLVEYKLQTVEFFKVLRRLSWYRNSPQIFNYQGTIKDGQTVEDLQSVKEEDVLQIKAELG